MLFDDGGFKDGQGFDFSTAPDALLQDICQGLFARDTVDDAAGNRPAVGRGNMQLFGLLQNPQPEPRHPAQAGTAGLVGRKKRILGRGLESCIHAPGPLKNQPAFDGGPNLAGGHAVAQQVFLPCNPAK
ncbi:hypothetical protein CVV67_16125 [Arthrobacter stackebrandtii]|nr:hypothetical protein CVV67_16125 [Arthrobacter stackebrandtii]